MAETGVSRLTYRQFGKLRRLPGATMGIFLTEYCPVQCGHCAVAAANGYERDRPENLLRLVAEMACLPNLRAVAITGGEPFARLDILAPVVDVLRDAGLRLVAHTSGFWGSLRSGGEIDQILKFFDGVVFGIDLYHRAYIPDRTLAYALASAETAGAWIVAQVIGTDGNQEHLEYARSVAGMAFGSHWEEHVQIRKTALLRSGRAEALAGFEYPRNSLEDLCDSINGPTILNDGGLAACCNENVVRHKGPESLRTETDVGLTAALRLLEDRPIVQLNRSIPPIYLLELASALGNHRVSEQPRSACEACWQAARILQVLDEDDLKKLWAMVALVADKG